MLTFFNLSGAAAILLDDKTLWVTGGESKLGCVQTTEILISNRTEWIKGPDLPECLTEHCMANLNNDTVLITGGIFHFRAKFKLGQIVLSEYCKQSLKRFLHPSIHSSTPHPHTRLF